MPNRTRRTAIDNGIQDNGQAWSFSRDFASFPVGMNHISIEIPFSITGGVGSSIVTIWNNGIISFGIPTLAQEFFIAEGLSPFPDPASSNPGFPGDFIAFEFDGSRVTETSFAFGLVDFEAPFSLEGTVPAAFFGNFDNQVIFVEGGLTIYNSAFATQVGYRLGSEFVQTTPDLAPDFEFDNLADFFGLGQPGGNGGELNDFLIAGINNIDVSGNEGNDVIIDEQQFVLAFPRGNSSVGNAWDLDAATGYWSTDENALFADSSIPHMTVRVEGEDQQEFFRIFMTAGQTLTVDVDYALGNIGTNASTDTVVQILDETGNAIAVNDDADHLLGGFGSPIGPSNRDSFLTFTAATDGFYYIQVYDFSAVNIPVGRSFLLNLSLTGHANIGANVADNVLFGNDGDDQLFGNAGADALMGGKGNDLLHGGSGGDFADYRDATLSGVKVDLRSTGAQRVSAELGFDTLIGIEHLYGSSLNDTLTGNAEDNVLFGFGGNDILVGSAGNDMLSGDNGFDAVSYADATSFVRINLATTAVQNTRGAGNDQLFGIERIIGTAFDDQLFGNDFNNRFDGGDGADNIAAGGGNDVVNGNAGNDVLTGGPGDDTMRGGADDDSYFVDTLGDIVIENADEGTRDMVTSRVNYTLGDNVERLLLTVAARVGTGNALDNVIFGTNAGDTLSGLDGADVLRGNGGRDVIIGGTGADVIDGGANKDTLTGGADRDMFQFRDGDTAGTRSDADIITDFDKLLNERIQLSLVDANSVLAGNQDFEWIATSSFSNVAGELRYQQINGNTYIEGDLNGDGAADYTIRLNGLYTLKIGDFSGVVDLFP